MRASGDVALPLLFALLVLTGVGLILAKTHERKRAPLPELVQKAGAPAEAPPPDKLDPIVYALEKQIPDSHCARVTTTLGAQVTCLSPGSVFICVQDKRSTSCLTAKPDFGSLKHGAGAK